MGHPLAARGLGQDLVAMIANDLICVGAEPAYMLDYVATASLQDGSRQWLEELLRGVSDACSSIGMRLVGGETAEMPGLFQICGLSGALQGAAEFDIAGFGIGTLPAGSMLPRSDGIAVGDVLIALPSSGLHSNGFSLVRKLLLDRGYSDEDLRSARAPWIKASGGETAAPSIGSVLLTPTALYVNVLRDLLLSSEGSNDAGILGVAHITGGGITGNVPRMWNGDQHGSVVADLDYGSWTLPTLFRWLQEALDMSREEMFSTFNCGVGMVLCVQREKREAILEYFRRRHVKAWQIGCIAEAER
uniref:phosphoribosylformylglycinamidine cyclo-ligase n=1 Tax=Pinguiococcus pyrenoidosus TaxID=172671 RepID=A0A7R9U865_9STRA|mmetsp:Transcript_18697/g.70740  ORF Transcript_18697/g.70740 Transcript_18697/m.70740 type:complete len:303 (+) Transcript_18697:1018-1926(+)